MRTSVHSNWEWGYDIHYIGNFNSIILSSLKCLGLSVKPNYTSDEHMKIKKEFIERHKTAKRVRLHSLPHIELHRAFRKISNNMEQLCMRGDLKSY